MNLKLNSSLLLLFLATFSVYSTDYISKSFIGELLAYLILIILVFGVFYDFTKAIFLYIFISLITPQFSRSLITEVVESSNLNVDGYYSFHSITILGLSLPIIFIIIAGIRASFKLYQNKIPIIKLTLAEPLSLYLMIMVLLISTTLINVIDGRLNEIGPILSDLRLVVIWIFSVFIFKYAHSLDGSIKLCKYIYTVLLFSVFVISIRTVLFIFKDNFNSVNSFDFSTQPYIGYPFLFAIIYCFDKSKLKMFFILMAVLSAFSLKRSDIAFVCVIFIVYILVSLLSNNQRYQCAAIKSTMYITIGLGGLVSILMFFAADAYQFLEYKINFFTTEIWNGELSNSALVRKLEFINILNDAMARIYPLFIGSGLGGYFDFSFTSKPSFIGVSDFSQYEIISNKYLRPHTFFNNLLLKGGGVYVCMYLFLIAFCLKKSIHIIWNRKGHAYLRDYAMINVAFFSVGYSIFCLNMFWQPMHAFLFSFIMMLLIKITQECQDEDFNC